MNCTICYNDIADTNKVITECNHIFHFTCLLKNYKNNHSTGGQCPLCRKVFLQTSNNSNTYTPPLVNVRSMIEIIRQRLVQPITPPPPRNRIIRNINRRRQIRQIRFTPRRQQIRTEIEELSFIELKDRLRSEGLSSRGYVRANLEKRLFDKLSRSQ
jgi:hypothetical protein